MSMNRRDSLLDRGVNPYGLGRNRTEYYTEKIPQFPGEYGSEDDYIDDDGNLYPSGKRNQEPSPSLIWIYGRNANDINFNVLPLGGDPSNEREQAAWLDRNGLVPQILLDDKRYYLNKRNWEWLVREAASMNNRSMLYQGIRDTAGLHKYMRNVYPDLVYLNRTEAEDEETNPLPPIAEFDKYPEEQEQEHQEEIQLLPFIYGQSNGSRSRYRKSPVLPESEDAIPLPISPNLRVPEDSDMEYTAGRPIRRDRARG